MKPQSLFRPDSDYYLLLVTSGVNLVYNYVTICIVYNKYSSIGIEDTVVRSVVQVLLDKLTT